MFQIDPRYAPEFRKREMKLLQGGRHPMRTGEGVRSRGRRSGTGWLRRTVKMVDAAMD